MRVGVIRIVVTKVLGGCVGQQTGSNRCS